MLFSRMVLSEVKVKKWSEGKHWWLSKKFLCLFTAALHSCAFLNAFTMGTLFPCVPTAFQQWERCSHAFRLEMTPASGPNLPWWMSALSACSSFYRAMRENYVVSTLKNSSRKKQSLCKREQYSISSVVLLSDDVIHHSVSCSVEWCTSRVRHRISQWQ